MVPYIFHTNAISIFQIENPIKQIDEDFLQDKKDHDIISRLTEENGNTENDFIDIDALSNWIISLQNATSGFFSDYTGLGAVSNTVSTWEALTLLRILGRDTTILPAFTDQLIEFSNVSLREEEEGYYASIRGKEPSMAGTWGVANILSLIDPSETNRELVYAEPTIEAYLNNSMRFLDVNSAIGGFGQFQSSNVTLRETYWGVQTYNLLPSTDIPNGVGLAIANYVESCLRRNQLENWVWFDDPATERSLILETYYAIALIVELNASSIQIPILFDQEIPLLLNWLQDNQKLEGLFEGGFSDSADSDPTVSETGAALATLHNLDGFSSTNVSLESANEFIYTCQYLNDSFPDENGGFTPNNASHMVKEDFRGISLKNAFWGIAGLLVTNDLDQRTIPYLETSFSSSVNPNNRTNEIIQGDVSDISLSLKLDDTPRSGISVGISVPSWNITGGTGIGPNFNFKLENDTEHTYNWTLGSHVVFGNYSLQRINFLNLMPIFFNTSIIVRYHTSMTLNVTVGYKPGTAISASVSSTNTSLHTFNYANITQGNFTAHLISPEGESLLVVNQTPVNLATNITILNFTIPENAVLGDWVLRITHRDVNDTEEWSRTEKELRAEDKTDIKTKEIPQNLYPGHQIQMNLTFAYSNGNFTSKANGTVSLVSNTTHQELLELPLVSLGDGSYQTAENITIPSRMIMGWYSIRVIFSWNLTQGYLTTSSTENASTMLEIKGVPIVEFESSPPNEITYGENVTVSFRLSIMDNENNKTPIVNTTIRGGIVNQTTERYVQILTASNISDIFYLVDPIESNLPWTDALVFWIEVLVETNSSYSRVYEGEELTALTPVERPIAIAGDLTIRNVTFMPFSELIVTLEGVRARIAIEAYSNILISFKIECEQRFVEEVNLQAFLKDPEGQTTLLPAVGYSKTNKTYQIAVALLGKTTGIYSIEVSALTAMAPSQNNRTLIGESITFELFESPPVLPTPPIEFFFFGITALGFLGVGAITIYLYRRTH